MRMGLVALVGTLVGLLGGTGWGAVQSRDALMAAHAEAAKAAVGGEAGQEVPVRPMGVGLRDGDPESSPADTSGADGSTAGMPVAGDPAAADAAEPSGNGEAGVATPDTVPPTPASAPAGPEAEFDVEGARRLGKILAAMKAPEAAGVLSAMSDGEAAAVLVQMNDRQAAPILAALPAERAAELGRLVLSGRGGGR